MSLTETWFIDGYIDFEYQKYKLLAYLKEVNKCFNESKLYPQLSDIIFHYRNIEHFRHNKQLLQSGFPKQLDRVNMNSLKLLYKKMLKDNELMAQLEAIADFAIDRMKDTINNGTELYEAIEQHLIIQPVGILPLYKDEGYAMLRYGNSNTVQVYSYSMSLFTDNETRFKGIYINHVSTFTKSITNTYEHIKRNLITTIKTLPNPAVYLLETPLALPFNETFLPIAKRTLMRHISQ